MLLNSDFFDYSIVVSEAEKDYYNRYGYDKYLVEIDVNATINDNIKSIRNLITQTGYSPNLDLYSLFRNK